MFIKLHYYNVSPNEPYGPTRKEFFCNMNLVKTITSYKEGETTLKFIDGSIVNVSESHIQIFNMINK